MAARMPATDTTAINAARASDRWAPGGSAGAQQTLQTSPTADEPQHGHRCAPAIKWR